MNDWHQWYEAHKEQPSPWPERLRVMHAMFGAAPGRRCKDCNHLLRYRRASTWFKCELSHITGGAATDWRAGWPACGKFEAEVTPCKENEA